MGEVDSDSTRRPGLVDDPATRSASRVSYRAWLLRILTWDMVLPAFVAFGPLGLMLLFPNQRLVVELSAMILPVVAFLWRLHAGWRQIALNHCSAVVQRIQFGVFVLGIMPLAIIDCLLILSSLLPKGRMFASNDALIDWAFLFGVYLSCMAIAMYPGKSKVDASSVHELAGK